MVLVLGPVGPDLRPDLDLTWDLDLDLSLTKNGLFGCLQIWSAFDNPVVSEFFTSLMTSGILAGTNNRHLAGEFFKSSLLVV